ncbi:MAG: sulfotransferase family protein [Bacteroidales bacterium]|nr:sulfotransferase family protein [Bacteroidales bacterium]
MSLKILSNNKNEIINNIELISIHIPKTGGRSFYEILKFVYGSKLDSRTKREDFFPDDQISTNTFEVPNGISVLHGHMRYNDVKDKIGRKTKIITWFRDPVDRVISNYYFLMYRISEEKIQPEQMDKAGFSLLEYARLKSERNVIGRFLDGSDLEDFFFVGDFHNFNQEVKSLGRLLGWPEKLPDIYENKTEDLNIFNFCTTKPSDITADIRNKIVELNNDDYNLYSQSIELRHNRNY